ncbi:putative ribonuclease H-like domain, reverse transcriptase zinc-binding domain-containing protein [Senna tora]|uniref:Putative ribonuclease H-like domain, reverse transcriptase zinc-binding domain-containing protein n=1 Tax=Senna tora TaxID=362788 RepID=A0A834TFJ6_9FABA|nr:putative ribonuclease H-like domain, reverse transcriptase zinc-binding domain-containing protein [Senna tora]
MSCIPVITTAVAARKIRGEGRRWRTKTETELRILVLIDEEDVANGIENHQQVLMGKLISEKLVNRGAMENAFRNIWGQPRGFKVEETGHNLFLFHLKDQDAMNRVLEGGSWSFRNRWLVLSRWKRGLNETDEVFSKGLVNFDLRNCLRKGVNMGNPKDGIHWLDLRYEKIPKYCSKCGHFGHDDDECEIEKNALKKGEIFTSKYLGSWLKAREGGKKVAWVEKNNTQHIENDDGGRRVGMIKKNETEALLERMAKMSMKESTPKLNTHNKGEIEGERNAKNSKGVVMRVENATNSNLIISKISDSEEGKMIEDGEVGRIRTKGTWKKIAREKENTAPIEIHKKRSFIDITNTMNGMVGIEKGDTKKYHLPIWLELQALPSRAIRANNTGKLFRFEKMWTFHDDCENVISENWGPTGAKLGSAPSFTWQSILKGREALELGITRRIGDGNGRWCMDVLRQTFTDCEVEAICSIPYRVRRGDDRWMWKLTSNGVFSVKSAYHALHEQKEPTVASHSNEGPWKTIWRLNIPPTTKLFLWRAVREILPTCTALADRGIDVPRSCMICDEDDESSIHALIGCREVNEFWKKTKLQFVTEWQDETDMMEWFNLALTQWSTKEAELFALAAQRVWYRRNNARVEGTIENLDRVWEGVNNT